MGLGVQVDYLVVAWDQMRREEEGGGERKMNSRKIKIRKRKRENIS